MIPVLTSDRGLSLAEVLQLPFFALCYDSTGRPVTEVMEFIIAVDPESLYFCARGKFVPHSGHYGVPAGTFVDGLWHYDVVELFVCDDNGSQYQEFNLSPQGLWWTGSFENYRVRRNIIGENTQSCLVSAVHSADQWRVGLSFQRSQLAVSCSWSSKSRCNVCAIFGQETRSYLSWASMPIATPDFHRIEYFETINSCRIV